MIRLLIIKSSSPIVLYESSNSFLHQTHTGIGHVHFCFTSEIVGHGNKYFPLPLFANFCNDILFNSPTAGSAFPVCLDTAISWQP